MRPCKLILCCVPLALAGLDQPPVRLLPVDPAGPCAGASLTLNTTTGTASRCVNGAWNVAARGAGVPMVSVLPPQCSPAGIPELVLLASAAPGLYACTGPNRWDRSGPTVYRADRYGSLPRAAAAAGNDAVILVPAGFTAVLDAPLVLAGSNVTLRCAADARIEKAFRGDAIRIAGRNIAIDGCRIAGRAAGQTGGLILLDGARSVLIRNCTLSGAATGASALTIYNSTGVTVSGNTLLHNASGQIFAQDGLDRLEIASNHIDSSDVMSPAGVDSIGVHTYLPGGAATNIRITGNTIVHGGDNFGIEVGAFGPRSIPPSDVTVADNSITLARDSNGAVSYSTLRRGSIVNNHINAAGHAIRINGIELVSTTEVLVIDNTLGNAAPDATYTIAINGGSRNTIRGNIFEGGIYVGTSRPEAPHVEYNLVEGNTLTAARAAALPRGLIWFQCNTFAGSVSRNIVRGNVLRGNSTGAGVLFENDYPSRGAVVDGNRVEQNRITGATTSVQIGPYVINTRTNPAR